MFVNCIFISNIFYNLGTDIKMRSREAKPLSKEELEQLRSLMERWTLTNFPYFDGSSESSDSFQVYYLIRDDVHRGYVRTVTPEELKERISKYGETDLISD